MRKVLVTIFVFLVAFSVSAGTISSISPTSITVRSGEYFLNINGFGLGDVVSFIGPAGRFDVQINARTRGGVVTWVPMDVANAAARYSVIVRGGTGDSNAVNFDVIDPNKLTKLALFVPEALARQAFTREGAFVKFDVTAGGGDDPDPVVSCSPQSGSLFKLGTTLVRCVATNRFGEQAAADFPVTAFDGAPPVVSVPKSFAVDASGPDGAFVKFDSTATDDIDGALPVTCTPASGTLFPVGVTTVYCTATDGWNNNGSGAFDVNVRWKSLVLHLPDRLVAEAQNSKGANVDFEVTATSPDDPEPVVKCDPKSGSFFLFGTSLVTCTASDRLGGFTEGRFELTVSDTVGPVVSTAYAKPEWLSPTGEMVPVTIVVDPFDVVDPMPKCSITGVTANEPIDGEWRVSGDLEVYLLAAHKNESRIYAVGVRCTDEFGNSTDGNANVTVSDKEPPQPLLTVAPAKKVSSKP